MLLKDKLKDKTLILASQSPRRREILSGAGLPFFLADNYPVEEICPPGMSADDAAVFLAALKSDAYPLLLAPDEILLTADTVVAVDGRILGKPRDHSEATAILHELSGRSHRVITGVTLRSENFREEFAVESRVWFRELSGEEITYYVDAYSPMDKAGAYGIQEWIGYVGVTRIEGSFYNVMGMPMQAIYVALDSFADKMNQTKNNEG